MVIMSVDLGEVRTGLAICDKMQILALPLCVISEKNREKLLIEICKLAEKHKVECIVVGLPKNMDGSEGEGAMKARAFAQKLHDMSSIDVVLQDERCTTITAYDYLNATNVRGQKRKKIIDSVAATVILQDYLQSLKNKG